MSKTLMFALNIQNFGAFDGHLRSNHITGALFNMIISQHTQADNVDGLNMSIVDKARTDGTLFGDTKLFYYTDAGHTHAWGADDEATNLLALARPDDPITQAIVLDEFRQIDLTIDYYLSKQAWAHEGAFSEFISVMVGWMDNTKRIYDLTTYQTKLGTTTAKLASQNISFLLPLAGTELDNRDRSMRIAEGLSALKLKMRDVSRMFNDCGFIRAFPMSRVEIIWNEDYMTKIQKLGTPTIFNDEKVFPNGAFNESMPGRFFGKVNESGSTTAPDNKLVRSLIEKDYNTVPKGQPGYDKKKFLYPGDLLPNSTVYEDGETYTEDPKVICKVVLKGKYPPFMSAFEVGTSFFNAKSLTENKYLTWGHNKIEPLDGYPFITISETNPKGK